MKLAKLSAAAAALTAMAFLAPAAKAQDARTASNVAADWLSGKLKVDHKIAYDGPAITVRFSSFIPAASPIWKVWQPALDRLSDMSNGKLKVQLYAGGVLNSAADGFSAVRDGIADMSHCYPSYQAKNFKRMDLLSLAGLFPDAVVGTAVATALYSKWFKKEYEAQGVYLGRLTMTPPYNIVATKEVVTPEDWQGLKVRAPGGIGTKLIQSMGAVPIFLSTTEAYTAMQRGTVDAVVGHDGSFIAFRSGEVAKTWSNPRFMEIATAYCVNKEFFDKLPVDLKTVFYDWLQLWSQADAQLWFEGYAATARKQLADMGLKMIELTDAQRAALYAKMDVVNKTWVTDMEAQGIPAGEMLSDAKAAAAKYEKMSWDEIFQDALKNPAPGLVDLK